MAAEKKRQIRIFPELPTNAKVREEFYKELQFRLDLTTKRPSSERTPLFLINRSQTRSLDALDEQIREVIEEKEKNRCDIFLFIQNEKPVLISEKSAHTFKETYKIVWSNQTVLCDENKTMFDDLGNTLINEYGYRVQFAKKLEDQVVKKGEDLVLEAKTAFILTIDPIWLKDDKPVDDAKYEFDHKNESYILSIKGMDNMDGGKYTLVIGEMKENSYVTISEPPKPPAGLEIEKYSKLHCELTWKQPQSDSKIIAYIIEMKKRDTNWNEVKMCDSSVSTCAVYDLPKDEEVQFMVRAVNAAGRGQPSEPTLPHLVRDPFSTPESPSQLAIAKFDKISCHLKWDPPLKDNGSKITGYIVEMEVKDCHNTSSPSALKTFTLYGPKEGTVYGLQEGTEVKFRVQAVNAAGPGKMSNFTITHRVGDELDQPNGPTNLRIERFDKLSCTLTWIPPQVGNNSEITGYIIEMKSTGCKWQAKDTCYPDSTTCRVFGLVDHEEVSFRVRAVNAAGQGNISEATSPHCVRDSFDPPDSPSDLRITSFDDISCTLTWNPPVNDEDYHPIYGYIIEMRKGGKTFEKAGSCSSSENTYTVYDCFKDEEVEFQIKAVNTAGPGAPSNSTDPQRIRASVDQPNASVNLQDSPDTDNVSNTTERLNLLRAVVNYEERSSSSCWSRLCNFFRQCLVCLGYYLGCLGCRRSDDMSLSSRDRQERTALTADTFKDEVDLKILEHRLKMMEEGNANLQERIEDEFKLEPGDLPRIIRDELKRHGNQDHETDSKEVKHKSLRKRSNSVSGCSKIGPCILQRLRYSHAEHTLLIWMWIGNEPSDSW